MKTRMIITLAVVLSILATACGSAAAPAPTDPLSVVQRYYEAIEANDIDKAATFFAEDIVMTDPSGMTTGKAAVIAAWKGYLDAGFTFDQSDFRASGERVTSCFKVYQNSALIDQGCSAVTHVRGGKIIFDGLEPAEAQFVVQSYYDAVNAKQTDAALAFIADDALFINPIGEFRGKDQIREHLQILANDGLSFDLSNFRNTDGRVVYDYIVLVNGEQVEVGTNGLTIVQNGKITFDGTEETEPRP
jgi:ketosteroid isomerase-like protein